MTVQESDDIKELVWDTLLSWIPPARVGIDGRLVRYGRLMDGEAGNVLAIVWVICASAVGLKRCRFVLLLPTNDVANCMLEDLKDHIKEELTSRVEAFLKTCEAEAAKEENTACPDSTA
jgi:hypothetical protein